MIRRWFHALLLPLVAMSVLATGIACVYVRHEARKLFVELQDLEKQRDQLEIEWGQLRIEQSAWASHARVENMARENLHMIEPQHDSIMAISEEHE